MNAPDRNLSLASEFLQAVLDDPALVEQIPDGVTLVLIPNDDPELARFNLDLGWKAVLAGEDVYFRHVRGAATPIGRCEWELRRLRPSPPRCPGN